MFFCGVNVCFLMDEIERYLLYNYLSVLFICKLLGGYNWVCIFLVFCYWILVLKDWIVKCFESDR